MDPEPGETARPDAYGEAWAEIYDEDHALMVPPDAQLSVLAELAAAVAPSSWGSAPDGWRCRSQPGASRSVGSMRRGRWWSAFVPSRAAKRSR